jgi:MinD superfamily P-loop ATPase
MAGDKTAVIAVLSGKGGTGKTMLSVNLAAAAENAVYIDCDVEEPNGHLFLKPEKVMRDSVNVRIPSFNSSLCTGCRRCVDFCRFNALAFTAGKVMLFEEICHSCGGCMLICPNGAVSPKKKTIGHLEKGRSDGVEVISGFLNVGEASGVPVIKRLLDELSGSNQRSRLTVVDCPPGTACTVQESISKADFCLLVAESTVFGAHNLEMVYSLVKMLGKPCGALLNKCTGGVNPSELFCKQNNIKIIGRILYDRELGRLISDSMVAVRTSSKFKSIFRDILEAVKKEVIV